MVSSVFSVNWTVWLVRREASLRIHLNYHDGLFIFSDLFGIDLNFYYSALHVSASSPGHMLIITKLVLATFPFPLGESESCSKTKRCTRKRFHWLSIFLKMFLKTHPLRGYIPPPLPHEPLSSNDPESRHTEFKNSSSFSPPLAVRLVYAQLPSDLQQEAW